MTFNLVGVRKSVQSMQAPEGSRCSAGTESGIILRIPTVLIKQKIHVGM